jgi:hypothetical protein
MKYSQKSSRRQAPTNEAGLINSGPVLGFYSTCKNKAVSFSTFQVLSILQLIVAPPRGSRQLAIRQFTLV